MRLNTLKPAAGSKSERHRVGRGIGSGWGKKLGADEIDLMTLKQAGIVSTHALDARVILSGEVTRKLSVRGIGVTAGAKAAIEAAGGAVIVVAKPAPVRKLPAKAR